MQRYSTGTVLVSDHGQNIPEQHKCLKLSKRFQITDMWNENDMWTMDASLTQCMQVCHGWLYKRHQRSSRQWARRWFYLDDRKGRLSYSHRKGSHDVRVSMPLQDISVDSVDNTFRKFCFLITCPPHLLVLSACSNLERNMWIENIRLRIGIWKSKVEAEGPKVAHIHIS